MIEDIAKRILKHYGTPHQKAKTIEELAELIVALQKDLLSCKKELSRETLEEVADVQIMLMQLLDKDDDKKAVNDLILYKIERQIQRIEKEKE